MKKLVKALSASVVAVALSATMVMSASAATADDAIAAVKAAGVPATNVQQLENFFKTATFTSDEYQLMIDTVNQVKTTYVDALVAKYFPGKTAADLTEAEKKELGQHWSAADKQAIIDSLKNLGTKLDVEVDVDQLTKAEYEVTASVKKDTNGDGKADTKGATVKVTSNPVAATGDTTEDNSAMVLAIAGSIVVLGATSVVVLSKKQKA